MNGSPVTSESRIAPRGKNISFTCYRENGETSTIVAVDASKIAARFRKDDIQNVLDAQRCDFEINKELYTAESKGIWEIVGQDRGEERIIGYNATPNFRATLWRRIVAAVKNGVTALFSPREQSDTYQKRTLPPFFEKVSRIHLYEAKEKFIFLESTMAMLQKLMDTERDDNDSTFWDDRSNNHLSMHSKEEVLVFCRHKLDSVKVLLTRRQNDLNFLWREMTQVHIYLLKWVIPDSLVPEHYDFCCEEAKKLAVRKEPDVDQLIKNIAEEKDSDPQKTGDMKRHIRALIERLSTIRTGRIHQQYVNVRCLRMTLVFLVPLLMVLIALKSVVLPGAQSAETARRFVAIVPLFGVQVNLLGIVNIINENILAFVCFSGLLGGFFSAAMRLYAKEYEPGADAYFSMYVFTKPLIGAIGAVVIYLLFQAGLFNTTMFESIRANGALNRTAIFGFSFLAGFSERIVFPTLK